MAAAVTGARLTTNIGASQLAIDIGKRISVLEPDVQILTVLTREIGSAVAVAPKFKWIEDESKPRFDTTSAAVASTTTTAIPVSHGDYFQQWDQVLNTRTGEQMRVDSVVANEITVTRAIGSTAANLLEGDELLIIGTAQPENDTSKNARSKTPSVVENYTQIFRTPYEISETAANANYMVEPKEWQRLQERAAVEHAKDIEYSFLFGRKSLTTPGSAEDRTTGGVLSFISSNQTDAGGVLSEAEWNTFMQSVMRYGTGKKLAICSGTGIAALNKFPASKQITKSDETTYGMNVSQYQGPFGAIRTVYHRLMEGSKYGGYVIVVDLDQVKYRPFQGRDTKLLPNRQPNDQDGKKDEYLTECGLEFGLQREHGLLSGITG
jgi:hypothetical protein